MEWIFFIIVGVLSRVLPHIPNMTAIGGMALFTGATYPLKKSVGIVFLTMLVSDMILGFHSVMWATYGCVFVSVIVGRMMKNHHTVGWIGGMTLGSSIFFFLITNFAVWAEPNFMYPKTITGLIECYLAAIPFFRNSLIGDFFYTYMFFGVYEYIHRNMKKLDFNKNI